MAIDWNLLITVGLTLVALAAVGIALHMSRARAVRYQPSTMLAEMSGRLEELTLRVIEVELALSRYRVGTAQLIGQVETLGAVPVWRPEWIGRGGACVDAYVGPHQVRLLQASAVADLAQTGLPRGGALAQGGRWSPSPPGLAPAADWELGYWASRLWAPGPWAP